MAPMTSHTMSITVPIRITDQPAHAHLRSRQQGTGDVAG